MRVVNSGRFWGNEQLAVAVEAVLAMQRCGGAGKWERVAKWQTSFDHYWMELWKGSLGRRVAAVKKGVPKCTQMVKLSIKLIKVLCLDLPAFQMSENSLSVSFARLWHWESRTVTWQCSTSLSPVILHPWESSPAHRVQGVEKGLSTPPGVQLLCWGRGKVENFGLQCCPDS